jgi:putative redox protein
MTAPSAKPEPRPPSRVTVKWAGGQQFDTGRENGPVARFDGSGKSGQSPPDAVLSALASCVSIDVVEILDKRRTPVKSLQVDVVGQRVDTTPRRFHHITLNFTITGEAIEAVHAERAVQLAVTKYCSVRNSLAPDILVDWTIDLR